MSLTVVAGVALLLASACKKSNEKPSDETSPGASTENTDAPLANFYAAAGPKAESFVIEASVERLVTLKSGTRITIPAGAFAVGGVAVKSGAVNVSISELPNRGAMALRGVNTMVGRQILITNGNLDMQANVAGRAVDRNLARPVRVQMADRVRNGRPLNLFEGVNAAIPRAGQQFDWQQRDVAGQPADIAPVNNSFTFNWPTTGWCNPDWFWSNVVAGSTFTTLRVDLPNNPGPLSTYLGGSGNTTVLFVPQGRNIIIQLYTPTATGVTSYGNDIPVGIAGRLLAYSVTSTGYFLATKDIVTSSTNPIVESLTFAPTTQAGLTAALNALSTY